MVLTLSLNLLPALLIQFRIPAREILLDTLRPMLLSLSPPLCLAAALALYAALMLLAARQLARPRRPLSWPLTLG